MVVMGDLAVEADRGVNLWRHMARGQELAVQLEAPMVVTDQMGMYIIRTMLAAQAADLGKEQPLRHLQLKKGHYMPVEAQEEHDG